MTSTLKADKIEGVTASGTVQMPAGMVIQTVSLASTTITRIQTASSSYVATGLSNSITPKFATSKLNVRAFITGNTNQNNGNIEGFRMTFFRDIGGAGFSDVRSTSGGFGIGSLYNTYSRTHAPMLLEIMDAPNTTSAVTYKVYVKTMGSAADVELPPTTEEHVELIIQEIAQ
tara:strand:+ start:131 stop:649 length:519 start_codon:yes stop_codon:yes gene_type:complete